MTSTEATTTELPRFEVDGLTFGDTWGPVAGGLDETLGDIPYQPFNKSDRLGKISDWSASSNYFRGNRYQQSFGDSATSAFAYKAEEDENSFSLVDSKPKAKPKFKKNWTQRTWSTNTHHNSYRNNNNRRSNSRSRGGKGGYGRGGGGGGGGRRYNSNYNYQNQEKKEASVDIPEDATPVATITFKELNQLWVDEPDHETLQRVGELLPYRSKFDTINPNNPKPLQTYARQFYTTTTSHDPTINALAAQQDEDGTSVGNVFITDTILALLLSATNSVNSWDIVIRKEGDNVWFDKRGDSRIDYVTQNENWNEVLNTEKDSPNHPIHLSEESTIVNHNFSQQALVSEGEALKFEHANPFAEDAQQQGVEPASVAYLYRRFTMNEKTKIVCRCEVNAYTKSKTGENELVRINAVNEFDPKLSGNVNYRQTLGQQTAAVLATEMKNNANKVTRWICESVLADVQYLMLGYVSRVHSKDNHNHVILKTQRLKPRMFANQIRLKFGRAWAVFGWILDAVRSRDDGVYLLVKDPNETQLHLYDESVITDDMVRGLYDDDDDDDVGGGGGGGDDDGNDDQQDDNRRRYDDDEM